jgi:hypothetical protein
MNNYGSMFSLNSWLAEEIAETSEKVEIATNLLFIYLASLKLLNIKQDKEFNAYDSF